MEPILQQLADEAKVNYLSELNELLQHDDCRLGPVKIKDICNYIPCLTRRQSPNTSDFNSDTNIVATLNYKNKKYYLLWSYKEACCQFCDPDASLVRSMSRLEQAHQMISLLASDLSTKIMSGHVFESLEELIQYKRHDNQYYELFKSIVME